MNMLQDFTLFLDVERRYAYCTLMKFGNYVYEMIFLFVLLIKSRLGEGEGNRKRKVK